MQITELHLYRNTEWPRKATIGTLKQEATVIGRTLEDAILFDPVPPHYDPKMLPRWDLPSVFETGYTPIKIPKLTAIPAGKYRLKRMRSAKFGRPMVYVLDVPSYTGILFHGGNRVSHTDGCVILGAQTDGVAMVWDCDGPLALLNGIVEDAEVKGECWLNIFDRMEAA